MARWRLKVFNKCIDARFTFSRISRVRELHINNVAKWTNEDKRRRILLVISCHVFVSHSRWNWKSFFPFLIVCLLGPIRTKQKWKKEKNRRKNTHTQVQAQAHFKFYFFFYFGVVVGRQAEKNIMEKAENVKRKWNERSEPKPKKNYQKRTFEIFLLFLLLLRRRILLLLFYFGVR